MNAETLNISLFAYSRKIKSMQRPRTEAIRTQIQSSKPKREITKITNSQNEKRTYGQPSEQLFPNMWPLSNPKRTKNNMNTRKVKPLTPKTSNKVCVLRNRTSCEPIDGTASSKGATGVIISVGRHLNSIYLYDYVSRCQYKENENGSLRDEATETDVLPAKAPEVSLIVR